jgi:hypothetical protein
LLTLRVVQGTAGRNFRACAIERARWGVRDRVRPDGRGCGADEQEADDDVSGPAPGPTVAATRLAPPDDGGGEHHDDAREVRERARERLVEPDHANEQHGVEQYGTEEEQGR